MSAKNYLDLWRTALPADTGLTALLDGLPQEIWQANPAQALADIIGKSERINWPAYLVCNPDVALAKVDPALHFASHGIFEGRELKSWHPLKEKERGNAPLVSVLVVCYNNALFVRKCLDSVVTQTMQEIEIIVVDDASSDGSNRIIDEFTCRDQRIKSIRHEHNCGTFISRKHAALAASGRYVMFVDADDYLAQNACETAYQEASKGYDMVQFGANVINYSGEPDKVFQHVQIYINGGKNKVYEGAELVNSFFIKRCPAWNLWSKMILREIVVYAYNNHKEGYFIRAEDVYAITAISRIARNMSKIGDILYNYNYGSGISTRKDLANVYERWFNLGETTREIGNYAKLHNMNIGFDLIARDHCRHSVNNLVRFVPDAKFAQYYDLIIGQYGFETVMDAMIDIGYVPSAKMASRFRNIALCDHKDGVPPRTIGLFYHRISVGGVEKVLFAIAHALIAKGMKVVIFAEERHDNDFTLPPGIELVYVRHAEANADSVKARWRSLDEALGRHKIDLMIHAAALYPALFWDMLVLRHYNIPVIVSHHASYGLEFMTPGKNTQEIRMAVLSCAAAVMCVAPESETLMRKAGVNACHIPNPVDTDGEFRIGERPEFNIAFMGRLDDPLKQISQSILVLKEVRRQLPWVKLYVIGAFKTADQRKKFNALLKNEGLSDNVVLTGWAEQPGTYLQNCGALLSTSYIESFGLAIAEAQALGLPAVVYDIPAQQIHANGGAIIVAQGDYEGAGKAIVELFEDEERWRRMSASARVAASAYAQDRFAEEIRELVDNFPRRMPWRIPHLEEYKRIVKYGAFYATHSMPTKLF